MKISISVPDKVFKSAEELAHRLGKSRSQLYTQAISSYMSQHGGEDVTARLNQTYAGTDSRLDISIQTLQSRSLLLLKVVDDSN